MKVALKSEMKDLLNIILFTYNVISLRDKNFNEI
jgi:hypothetical protein